VSSLNEHRKGKAVLYARVSSDEQVRHGYSLDQQIVALREWTTSENYVVLEEIRDEGWSGAKKG
jgi:site-specific DNA recombinase